MIIADLVMALIKGMKEKVDSKMMYSFDAVYGP